MHFFRRPTINGKLRVLVLMASGVAVLLSSVVSIVINVSAIRDSTVKQMSSLAEVLAANSTAALDFNDEAAATEILSSLTVQQDVELACLYDAEGEVFAQYHRSHDNLTHPPLVGLAGYQFADGYLDVSQPIYHDNRRSGTIYLHVDMGDLRKQVVSYVLVGVLVMGLSLLAAFALSTRLQRAISLPILQLAETAERISREQDYSIRVQTTSADEIGTLYHQFNDMLTQIQQGGLALQEAHDQLEKKVQLRTQELSEVVTDLHREVAERARAETELKDMHQQLMDVARRAGMAEIATGVLHNVGNVLNSINVSASVAVDQMNSARIEQLSRVVELLNQQGDQVGKFLTDDPKGRQILNFLTLLAAQLAEDKTAIIKELGNLTTKIDHVKTIVSTQQSYAGISGVIEIFDVAATVDDALKLDVATFERHRIEVIRDFEQMPDAELDKQKLLQILVNLVKNGKDALVASENMPRQLTFRTSRTGDDHLRIQVSDNGVGIQAENLTRVFSHGFTTKAHGHGFGLHSCANAATEMGGTLTVSSDGPGHGATFTLELPLRINHGTSKKPADTADRRSAQHS